LYILGIDLGTTNLKACVYREDGTAVATASRPTPTHRHPAGYSYHDADEVWGIVAGMLPEVAGAVAPGQLACIGITSMAESGVLLDRRTGETLSPLMPWFDPCSEPQARRVAAACDPFERFTRTGLRMSFKMGLAKLLWLKEHYPDALRNSVWVSAAGLIAHRLTGRFAFDYTLAARTFAFRLDTRTWDADWIRSFGLQEALFPDVLPSGQTVGRVRAEVSGRTGLPAGVPVAIGGHDHVCAALAAGAFAPGQVYDSMGTAETLVGSFPERPLTRDDFESGLSFGLHIVPGMNFWMGGNSASGGSIEWIRRQLGDEPVSYEAMLSWLEKADSEPTGIFFYPYLSGSGAPMPDSGARAAWIGLTKNHSRTELVQSILEGTAYQLEAIRRCAERVGGRAIETMRVVGGGTRIASWLQIKADVTGCRLELPAIHEATMLGAALAAGIGCGLYASAEEAVRAVGGGASRWIEPNPERHRRYRRLYEDGYDALQQALREMYARLKDL
jgi:xylulokinase